MKYTVIILAAGQGKRMKAGMNKQFILLQNQPLIVHTLRVFQEDEWCEKIILVGNKQEIESLKQLVYPFQLTKVIRIVQGGKERQDSVYQGLSELTAEELVLIHDGARPFINHHLIHELVQVAKHGGAAIPAVPIKDTVKKVDDGKVVETVDRSSLWAVQTPQAFRLPIILEAHEKAKKNQYLGTDDASLVERLGLPVEIVLGDYANMKLTTPEDMLFAEAIFKQRQG